MLTKFQKEYLLKLVHEGLPGGDTVKRIVFAVTSANHDNTRRNPVPLYLRSLAIEEFSHDIPCEVKIYPIKDISPTDRFAEYLLRQIFYQSGETLSPTNTVVACSIPSLIGLFEKLGFQNLPVELAGTVPERYHDIRSYEVIQLLAKTASEWRKPSAEWRTYASAASIKIYDEYNLGDLVGEVFADRLLTDDADITETRDYHVYTQGMDAMIDVKFKDIKPFVVQGKIVDVGCSTGSLIQRLATTFHESDIIGIEAVRRFYEYCIAQDYGDAFVFFYRRNVTDQNFKENTISTFIYSSILHEIYSYIGEATLRDVLRNTWAQLNFGGRIIIRDVVGPENPDEEVYMELNVANGAAEGEIADLSTYAKFFRFATDFKPRKISFRTEKIGDKDYIVLSIRDAYEYISKMNYAYNWESEMHETFGFYSFSRWIEEFAAVGFSVVEGSRPFQNPYIIEKSYRGNVTLFKKEGDALQPIDFPPTNMILIGEKRST
jgi:SAM-dependent methyltransferase